MPKLERIYSRNFADYHFSITVRPIWYPYTTHKRTHTCTLDLSEDVITFWFFKERWHVWSFNYNGTFEECEKRAIEYREKINQKDVYWLSAKIDEIERELTEQKLREHRYSVHRY